MNLVYLLLHGLWLWLEIAPFEAVNDLWILFALYWLVSALKRKKTKQREAIGQRLAYILPLVCVFYLLYNPRSDIAWLGTYFVPHTLEVQWGGVAVMVFGLGIARPACDPQPEHHDRHAAPLHLERMRHKIRSQPCDIASRVVQQIEHADERQDIRQPLSYRLALLRLLPLQCRNQPIQREQNPQ